MFIKVPDQRTPGRVKLNNKIFREKLKIGRVMYMVYAINKDFEN